MTTTRSTKSKVSRAVWRFRPLVHEGFVKPDPLMNHRCSRHTLTKNNGTQAPSSVVGFLLTVLVYLCRGFPRQMFVKEKKAKGKTTQYSAIDEAIKTAQFVRNKCVSFWMDNKGVGPKNLYRYNTLLRAEFPFVNALNSHACQASVERAYSSIARFYDNCKKSIPGKKGFPKFKKNCRCVEYKTSGWKLSETRKQITFTP